jgi:predicted RNA binding protein YcfA (HicA-like mRNA interferase family)
VKVRQAGSHATVENGALHATIPVHGSRPIATGTLASILRSVEIAADELRELL